MPEEDKKIFIFAAIVILSLGVAWALVNFIFPLGAQSLWENLQSLSRQGAEPPYSLPSGDKTSSAESQKMWRFTLAQKQLLFTGGYADPSVIKLDDGQYLMFLAKRHHGTFILGSQNAFSWYKMTDIIFPGIEMAHASNFNGGVRIYYPDRNNDIASLYSADGGAHWLRDGDRALVRDDVDLAGPSVVKIKNDLYRMFFSKVGEIYGATSADGMNWEGDIIPTVSSPAFRPFVINWTHPDTKKQGYLMLYNSDINIVAAYSPDGFEWHELGDTGIAGAGISAIHADDGLRIYFSDLAVASGIIYTGILNIEYR